MRSEDLCKFGKEYLIPLTCKFYTFSRQNLENFDISNVILPLLIINFKKNSPVSDHTIVICYQKIKMPNKEP